MSDREDQIVRELPIEWRIPDSLLTSRTNYVTIQQSGVDEFTVSFFERRLPTIIGSLEEQLERFNSLEVISAICTARLTINHQELLAFSATFNETIEEFQQTQRQKKE